jgi:hypothetical protein
MTVRRAAARRARCREMTACATLRAGRAQVVVVAAGRVRAIERRDLMSEVRRLFASLRPLITKCPCAYAVFAPTPHIAAGVQPTQLEIQAIVIHASWRCKFNIGCGVPSESSACGLW